MKIGIIGVGYWGKNYARIFNELGHQLYCCDIDKTKRIKGYKFTTDYKQLEVDAVVVSTPPATHYEITKYCLEAGKDVLVEKPITLNAKEAEELVQIAKEEEKILMVGHTFIYNPAVQKLKDYDVGDICYLYSERTGLGLIRNDVNSMWDLAPHDISIFLYLLDAMPTEVFAVGHSYLQNDIEDVVFITLKFPNNILANIHVSWLDPYKIRRTTVVGTKKMVVFDDINKLETLKIFDKGVDRTRKVYADYGEFQLSVRDGDVSIPKIEMTEPLKNQCKHFIDCVINRKKPLTDGENGLNVVRILEKAEQKLRKK